MNRAKRELAKLNPRRHELIEKKYDGGGLTEVECVELNQLQQRCGRLANVIAPLDTSLIDKLLERARAEGCLIS